MMLYIVIGLFAGLRPAEIERLRWSMIDLGSKQIMLPGSVAKRRKRRNVELSNNLVAWLTPLVGKPICPKNFRRNFDAIRRLAGFKGSASKKAGDESLLPWPHDVIRHTAISHHFAAFEDEGKTAKWAGQSPEVMHTHYKGLVCKEDSQIFWGLKPPTISGEATND
jgi:integrase